MKQTTNFCAGYRSYIFDEWTEAIKFARLWETTNPFLVNGNLIVTL